MSSQREASQSNPGNERPVANGALSGLRVIDLSWMVVGPALTKLLAFMGAEVIKIESVKKIDGVRPYGPWADRVPTPPNGGGWFEIYNRNKKSVCLNLKTKTGIELCKRLIRLSDLVVENWTAGTAEKFGLDYGTLESINPGVVMISLTLFGQTGRYSRYVGYDRMIQPLSGVTFLTGMPDGTAYGHGTPFMDHIGAIHGAVAVLAALEYRRKTGKGQYIDLSMHEAGVSMLGVQLLDYLTNRRVQERIGNQHTFAAPHGCYRCKGEDRWCVISIFGDPEWESFAKVAGNLPWVNDPRFATVTGRLANSKELDNLVEAWTIGLEAEEVVARLQEAGVAAGLVRNIEDIMLKDPHIKARGFFTGTENPAGAKVVLDGVPYKHSVTPGKVQQRAPLLGEHTDQVLSDLLGISRSEIAQLKREGVLE